MQVLPVTSSHTLANQTNQTAGGYMTFSNSTTKSRYERIHTAPLKTIHDYPKTSVNLLDSLESFLSTFKKDLSAVSGQISELQDRSKAIENRLTTRRASQIQTSKIEKTLSGLLSDITIPPALATLILDSPVREPWIEGIDEFERRLVTIKARSRVKAARDLWEVAEGLRIVAATKIRAFFLALFQPIRGNATTNMQVVQTSVLLKYNALYAFLQRHAPDVAHEIQRSYVAAARVYYETGFRRYIRSLTWIKARFIEKHENIVVGVGEQENDSSQVDLERLAYAKIVGPGVTLAYMADDKSHKEPIEALFRSLLLVFMDNATSEYTFVKTFFSVEPSLPTKESSNSMLSPLSLRSPDRATFAERSMSGSDYGGGGGQRSVSAGITGALLAAETANKEEQATTDALWKQVMDPVTTYCEASLFSSLSTKLQMWPVFQKVMAENAEALKKLAEGGGSGYFNRAIATTDASVSSASPPAAFLFLRM
ncbi:hypothetical protein C0992_007775 [Termitomyces sp. T32_za158]|nr:hypothetical protein C0992_007775 [Termitomyces sp. T32_za158]